MDLATFSIFKIKFRIINLLKTLLYEVFLQVLGRKCWLEYERVIEGEEEEEAASNEENADRRACWEPTTLFSLSAKRKASGPPALLPSEK